MAKNTRYTIYGDFNCPFCYALSERLASLKVNPLVEWRMIEHAPAINSRNFSTQEQTELAEEVFTVRHRAPEVAIALPPARPNTALANGLFIRAIAIDPAKAIIFRNLVYRALWVDGEDISELEIIRPFLLEADLDPNLEADQHCEQLAREWKQQWSQGSFDQRIPASVSEDRRIMLGLGTFATIHDFFSGSPAPSKELYACSFKQRHIISVVGDIQKLWPIISMLRYQCDIRVADGIQHLTQMLEAPAQTDLILLDKSGISHSIFEFCLDLSRTPETNKIPVVVIDEKHDIEEEVAAYECGVADYILQDIPAQILQAKITRLLQLKRSTDMLEKAARTDNLTQIYNRREFEHSIELEWKRGIRAKHPVGILMIDIDYFKNYNDHYGHLAGDGCLRLIAQTLKETCNRSSDIIARYGGEEFVALLPNTDYHGAKAVADDALRAINQLKIPHPTSEAGDTVSISIGIGSMIPEITTNPRMLIDTADQNLYSAKARGRNQVFTAPNPFIQQ